MELPHNFFLYLLLLAALAIGFFLGRREPRSGRADQQEAIRDYYQGLNFLLGERPELGVDRFIQAMEVNDESIGVHLALASVVRRRGEVDKAIRIHQNLLASPTLTETNQHSVEYELARDYHVAGLLDRAEGLLTTIVSRRDAQLKPALELLVDLYEQEREWQKAIDVIRRAGSTASHLKVRLSHFHCELGEGHLHRREFRSALDEARRVMQTDAQNPRGCWLAAEIEHAQKRHKRVLKHLQRVVELAPDLSGEVAGLYARSCESLGTDSEYVKFLESTLETRSDAPLLASLIDYRRRHGLDTDVAEVVARISRAPHDEHLPLLLDLLERAEPAVRDQIMVLLRDISARSREYQCQNCGFRSHLHLWHCPTCKQWGDFSGDRESHASL